MLKEILDRYMSGKQFRKKILTQTKSLLTRPPQKSNVNHIGGG